MDKCTYTARVQDRHGGKDYACGNEAHRDGKCKFHLDGYLDESTAGEIRDLFWDMHDGSPCSLMNCTGYALPPLAREGEAASVRRALRLDSARFGLGGAGLSGITFEQHASFRDVEFIGGAGFRGCTFKKGADFSRAAFRAGTADFKSSRFAGTADFFHADFFHADFDWAIFAGSRFNKAVFRDGASFYGATFGSAAGFHSARFLGEARFEESEFKMGGDFAGARFKRPAYFRGVKMKCPSLVRFDGNVSNVSFLNTDVKEIGFGSMTTWSPQERPGSSSIWDRKWRIYDEKSLDDESPDPALNLENVRGVYRDLRDNFDRQLRYDMAGGFFVREMEVGRKYKVDDSGHVALKPVFRRALTWNAAYNVIAEYGQSLGRPSLFLALTLVAGSLVLWCGTGVMNALEFPCEDGLCGSALRSLEAMVPFPLSGHLASPVDFTLKAAALPCVATFLIALRRRFEKTRRH